jgi:hypothetical protein
MSLNDRNVHVFSKMERAMKKLFCCISICTFLLFATSCSSVNRGNKPVAIPAAAPEVASAPEVRPAPESAPALPPEAPL